MSAWLSKHHGGKSASSYNQALTVVRDALDMAVADKIIIESPAAGLKYRRPAEPIRPSPSFEQFKAIVANVRGQRFNADAEDSGDFVEALGLLGLRQAEAASIKRSDVDLDAARIVVFRHKTSQGFTIPIFPQARELVAKLCKGKKPHQRLFMVRGARRAIDGACRRLGFVRELPDGRLVAQFTHRSLRRMFITRCLGGSRTGLPPLTGQKQRLRDSERSGGLVRFEARNDSAS